MVICSLCSIQSMLDSFQIIRMLTEKCRHQEEEIAAFEQKEQEHQQVLAEVNMLQEQVTFAQ